MPNVALFVGFVTATREARKKYGDTQAPTIVHCRLEMFVIMFDVSHDLRKRVSVQSVQFSGDQEKIRGMPPDFLLAVT